MIQKNYRNSKAFFSNDLVQKQLMKKAWKSDNVQFIEINSNGNYVIDLFNGKEVLAGPKWSQGNPNNGFSPRFMGFEVAKYFLNSFRPDRSIYQA